MVWYQAKKKAEEQSNNTDEAHSHGDSFQTY